MNSSLQLEDSHDDHNLKDDQNSDSENERKEIFDKEV